MKRIAPLLAVALLAFGLAALPPRLASRVQDVTDFVHFESPHVHPACLTPSGARLLVVNTPDARLAVFDLTGATPRRIAEIPVGLEPVSVAALDDSTAWVVNQLSDDVSVVNLNTLATRASVRVGDEPWDVVFAAGSAYVSVGQEDVVRVYDSGTLALQKTIAIPGRQPRALARNAAGTLVYAAVFHAGNRTSVLAESEVPNDSMPPASPSPPDSIGLIAPNVGLIIRQQPNGTWADESGKTWNHKAKYSLAEVDVAELSTATRAIARTFGDLGTVNFGLAVAADGRIATTGTEARNLVRFEPNVRGHLVDTRVSFVAPSGATTIRSLDPDANYAVTPGPQAERDSAVGIPMCVAWSADGQRAYVTSLTSDRLAVVDPNAGADAIVARVPTVAGPSAVVEDAARGRLYVVGRFRNQLQTLSAATLQPLHTIGIGFDPTPDAIVNGRKFFYGGFTSGHGDQACATCHVSGDFDAIAWDLGDPLGHTQASPPGMLDPLLEGFHPMKGPMTTQTLRGLNGTGRLHWRADRANLDAFNGAFVSLMGRGAQLPDSEMAAFDAFTLALVNPPNPNQRLDRGFADAPPGQPSAARGQAFYLNAIVDGPLRCNDCHTATNFGPGTNGQIIDDAALLEDQDIKVPQLRNLYRKTGFRDSIGLVVKRGFGYLHDGSMDNLFDFLRIPVFNFGVGPAADANRRDVESFLLAFDTGMAPAVGFQLTFFGANNSDAPAIARLDTLKAQAALNYCDLVAKGRRAGQPRGWLYLGADAWKSDKAGEPNVTTAALRGFGGAGGEITITGVPDGTGQRAGLDRDRDGYLDGDELDAGSDPGNPLSTPLNAGVEEGARAFALRAIAPNPFRDAIEVQFTLGARSRVDFAVYDVLGREVRSVANGLVLEAGPQSLRWDGRDRSGARAPAGVYFARVVTDGGRWTRAIVRVR